MSFLGAAKAGKLGIELGTGLPMIYFVTMRAKFIGKTMLVTTDCYITATLIKITTFLT